MPARTAHPDDGIVDLVAVDRVVDTLAYAPLTTSERAEAARRLAARGHGVTVIARVLRCNVPNVRDALTETPIPARRGAVTYTQEPR